VPGNAPSTGHVLPRDDLETLTTQTAMVERIEFGPFTVDVGAKQLLRNGVELDLRPQAFQVLRTLVRHSGSWVNYDQMMREAWDGMFISKHTVAVTVGEVKRALNEYSSWITCRPKVGYRLSLPQIKASKTENAEAEELVKTGLHLWSRRTREGFEKALICFEQAAAKDSRNARAFEGGALCYLMLGTYGMRPPREIYSGFLGAHARAVELAGMTPELRCSRAHGLHMYERKLAEAEVEFLQALREKPTLVAAYVPLAILYATMGRLDDAVAVLAKGSLADPLSTLLPATEVLVRICRREYDLAVACGARSLNLHPYLQLGRAYYGQALEFSGRTEEAMEQYKLAWVMSPDLPWVRALEARCLACHGRRKEAGPIFEELEHLRASEYVDAYFMALLMDALGRRKQAFQELERAVEENSANLYTLDVDPKMDPLRDDARFTRLRKKLFANAGTL
jgi:DNA-binding winged helix-turn-helix (wHTH) protein